VRGYQMRAQEGVFADRFKYLHEADPAQALRAHPHRRPHPAAACHFRRSCRPFCDAVHHPTTTPSPTHHPLVHPGSLLHCAGAVQPEKNTFMSNMRGASSADKTMPTCSAPTRRVGNGRAFGKSVHLTES